MRGLCIPDFAKAARSIRLLGVDFDGVMTDNNVFVFEDGREAVCCSRFDGIGVQRLTRAGVEVIIISTEPNPVVRARSEKLGISCIQNVKDKVVCIDTLLERRRLKWREVAFIGNDSNDFEVLKRAGLPIVVADAHEALNSASLFRTIRAGGHGAVREVCDAIASVIESNSERSSA